MHTIWHTPGIGASRTGCSKSEKNRGGPVSLWLKNDRMHYEDFFGQKIAALKEQGNYRYFLDIARSVKTFPVFTYRDTADRVRSAINFCSNDYLGQSIHPLVIAAAKEAIDIAGTGSGGTRNISGSTIWHSHLERTTARLVQKPSAIVFNSSYLANQTVLATLGRHLPHGLFISDAENHASMIEGMRASKREKIIFRHNDIGHLTEILQAQAPERPKIIAFESIYSMSGTVAPIRDIVALAKQFNAFTYCDEVHAVGLYGEHGGGLIAQLGASDGVDLINGTFAKAFGVIGGFVAGSESVIDFIRSHAEGFIFTTSLPPSNCAAILKSIEIVRNEPETRQKFHQNVVFFRKLLDQLRIPYQGQDAHITRIVIGDSQRCKAFTDQLLFEQGIYIQPINYPTVARGEESMRVIVSAKHHDLQIEQLALALKTVLS